MSPFEIIILIVLVLGFAAIAYFILKPSAPQAPDQSIILMQQQLQQLRETLDLKLNESQKQLQSQFSESQRAIQTQAGQSMAILKDVTEKLVNVENATKQVGGVAEQIKGLENILKNPKQRGILGEYFLETVLKNTLPPEHYQMQYKFEDGEIVDAAIFLQDKILPIDSKFSLENYNRLLVEEDPARREELEKSFKNDLKKRIDETSKYIRPRENTMDFAFMFIPSEGIYYDILINQIGTVKINTQDLIEYAFNQKHVIIVSPTSFFAYLQTILQGLRALRIEETAKDIRKRVEELGRHLIAYDEYMKKVGNNLGTTVNMYNNAYKEFKKIDKDVVKISGVGGNVEPLLIDKPQGE